MEPQVTTDISDYIAALKRRRMLLLCVMGPIVVLAASLALGLPDRYVSRSLIDFAQGEISGQLPNRRQEKEYADQYVSSLTDAVLDGNHLKELLKGPNVPEVLRKTDPAEVLDDIVSGTKVDTVRVPVLDPDSGREREIVSAFTVGYQSADPQSAHDVAVWMTDAFMAASRDILKTRAHSSAQFYTTELDRYRDQIGGLESKLADFKAKNFGQLPELQDLNLNVIDRNERDLDNVELQLANLRQSRIFLAQQLDQARNASPDQTTLQQLEGDYARKQAIYDPDHPDLINLRRQIESLRRGGPAMQNMSLPQQLEAQKAILSETRQRYSADHPDVRRIQRQIEDLQARIARGDKADSTLPSTPGVMQVQAQINGVDTQIASLQARGNELRSKMEQLTKRVEATPQVERAYQNLTRDLQLARTRYDELLKNRMDAELTEAAITGGRSDELRVVQPAAVPLKPAKPLRLVIAAAGIVLAFVFGFGAVVVAEAADQTVRGSRDVRRVLDVAPLAVIPEIVDASSIRRQRFKLAILACCTVVVSFAVVLTLRSLT